VVEKLASVARYAVEFWRMVPAHQFALHRAMTRATCDVSQDVTYEPDNPGPCFNHAAASRRPSRKSGMKCTACGIAMLWRRDDCHVNFHRMMALAIGAVNAYFFTGRIRSTRRSRQKQICGALSNRGLDCLERQPLWADSSECMRDYATTAPSESESASKTQ